MADGGNETESGWCSIKLEHALPLVFDRLPTYITNYYLILINTLIVCLYLWNNIENGSWHKSVYQVTLVVLRTCFRIKKYCKIY